MFALIPRRAAFAAGLVALAAACPSVVAAGAVLEVNPVRLTLSHALPVAALTVRNAGAQPVVLQLTTVAWAQDEGQDRYTPTRELLATPPIFTLAPGAAQTVRVGLRRAPDAQRELAYRLYVREIPGAAAHVGTGVRISLRIGVPVFASPRQQAAPRLQWRAERAADGVWLHARNDGNAHVQVAELALGASGQPPVVLRQAAYLLPGHGRRWRFDLPDASAGRTLILRALTTNAGAQDVSLVLE